MWKRISHTILNNRKLFISILIALTIWMGYEGSKLELSYSFARVLPDSDETYQEYEQFRQLFGEDGNVMVLSVQDKDFYEYSKFADWYRLGEDIRHVDGIQAVVSVTHLYSLKRNDSLNKFDTVRVVKHVPQSQEEVDSLKAEIRSLPIYDELLYNKETGAILMAITFKKKDLNTKHRLEMVDQIGQLAKAYGIKHKQEMHYSGMPYIRSAFMKKVSGEMKLFLILAVLVTALILWMVFRSFSSVFFSILVVAVGVVWTFGTLSLFGYKITVLTGLIPPLIMVIGVPNCVFLINKYQREYLLHGDKYRALVVTMEQIGVTLFLANVTTAIGFGVLYFAESTLLVEFGLVAAVNVMITYAITLILIPIIQSYLPVPAAKATRHLEGKRINKVLGLIDHLVHNRRKSIYFITATLTLVCFYGMTKIDVIGFIVDDLPQNDPIYNDLHYMEKHFKGVLPFEVLIDTKKKNGVFADNSKALYKIKRLQRVLGEYKELSKSVSLVDGIRFAYQAYNDGEKKYYILPGITELQKLNEYTTSLKGSEDQLGKFIDTSRQFTRVSLHIADVGSARINEIAEELRPRIDSIFPRQEYNVKLTGHSLMFLKGNDYLLENLFESLIIEILLITMVGLMLFRSVRIILLSKLPCLIPLVMTAGIMGYLGIRFKPSTILIFSIAFGISSDGTIYFLSKYRQELKKYKRGIPEAISVTIRETGISMIYTTLILFCGFSIFAASSFGGTVALGILISITLMVSLCTNLVLLPAILLSIDRRRMRKELLQSSLIELDEPDEE